MGWLVQATDYRKWNEPPGRRLQRNGAMYLMARPPLLCQGGEFAFSTGCSIPCVQLLEGGEKGLLEHLFPNSASPMSKLLSVIRGSSSLLRAKHPVAKAFEPRVFPERIHFRVDVEQTQCYGIFVACAFQFLKRP